MKNKKMLIIGACLLLCGMTVVGTYAWMTTRTNDKINNFKGANLSDMEIVLKEDKFEEDKALRYLPNDIIQKNPTIENKSKNISVYAAIKVTYQVKKGGKITDISEAEFQKYAKIDKINDGWEAIKTDETGRVLYMYQGEVKAMTTITPELFTAVLVNGSIALEDNGTLPAFHIKVEGFATQYKNTSLQSAKDSLIEYAGMTK